VSLPVNDKPIIRVFPRRTKWTPNDEWCFFDEPPLYELPDLQVMVSVTFSWDVSRGEQLSRAWRKRMPWVCIGGPAHHSPGPAFVPGRFIRPDVTFTSRGCPKRCPWCLVPQREGKLRELEHIAPGNIVQDNNLLACSQEHFERVCEMLSTQKAIKFSGGLDIDYLTPWHVDRLKKLRVKELWVACDRAGDLPQLAKARDLLGDFPERKRRCYVLGAFGGEPVDEAHRRCEQVYEMGFLPFAQFYRGMEPMHYSRDWKRWARKWSRPAAYRRRREAQP
jgi:hypothetical protein